MISGAFAVRSYDYFRVTSPNREDHIHMDPVSLACAAVERGRTFAVMYTLNKVKNILQKVRADAALAKQKAEALESAAEAEQRDARALQAALPEAMEVVTGAEDAVETVAILAAAMSADDDVDTSEAHQVQAIQDIETSASKASNDLMEARKLVSNRLRDCKKYAPEAKKVATQEFEAMEKRLTEATKRLAPLRKFRQEFEQKIAAKKALQEIQNKLNSAELEIEKAHIMTSSTDTQMEQGIPAALAMAIAKWLAWLSLVAAQRPICQMSDAFAASVDMHIKDWDSQIDFALNESLNCSDFLEYVYLSRDRIRAQLDYVRGNFSAEDEAFRLQGAVLTSHNTCEILKDGDRARPECLNEHLQLLFLMSLRRMKHLLHSQLRHLWLVFQGTAELVRQGAGKWLAEVVDLFEADIRTYESIMVNWRSKEEIEANSTGGVVPLRPGPPLPPFDAHEADGLAWSTMEVLRRDTFEEWQVPKPLLRALLRYVLPRDSHVADFCAGAGQGATFLNDTGLVKAFAFDASTNIKLLSKNEPLRIYSEEVRLWTSFDVTMCLKDFGSEPKLWTQVWQNIEVSTKRIAVLNCGKEPSDDITSTSQLLGPAEEDLQKTWTLIHQRQPIQDAAAQKELEAMKKRVTEAREKLKSIRDVLKRQEETLQVDGTLAQVHEKIEHAEEAFLATSEAEMPFLKGLEVLPVEEGIQAVAQCEAAIKKCEAALEAARNYIKKVESDSKTKFSKEALQHLMGELTKCRQRGEDTEKKLIAFRKETRQRKAKGMVQEVNEKVVEAENQSQALAEVVQVLHTDNLDTVTVDSLKTAFEQSVAAEREAVKAYNEARTIITAKQKEVKEQPVLSELSKLQKKLAAAHQEMIKSRQLAKGGDALIKGKKVVNDEERKVVAMEQAVEKVEKQMPKEDQEVSKEDLLAMDAQIKSAIAAVHSSQRSLEQQSSGATAALKASLTKLMKRVTEASARVEKAKQASKTQREKAAAEVFVKEAEQQVEQVEAALVKVAEAELPFLKGIEVLPLSEASTAIAECEKAAKQVQEALEKAKGFVNTKVLEVQRFAEAAAKPCLERLNGLVERNNAAASKLAQFRKDTESHKRTSQMQEAEEMLNAAEAEVEKTKEAGAPLTAEDLSSITSQTGTEICEKIASLEKAANKKVQDALVFLAQRRQDVRGTPQEKHLEQLQARLGKIKASLGEAKKQASQQEQRFVSRKLQTEGAELVNEVESEVKKTEVAAGPLLKSSSFLVRGNVQRLSGMVQDVIGKGTSKDKLFKQACGDDAESVAPATFQSFVTWMTESNGDSEGFLEQEVEAMFKHLDKDEKGHLTENDFQGIFSDQFACVQPVSMTENFSISDGKSVIKLDLGVAVEALGMPQYDEQQKLTRLRCRLLEDLTKEGWVTMKGNQGKVFLDRLSPHSANQKSFDRMISASSKVVNKAASFLTARRKELTDCSSGPLLEARVKMDEFKVKVSSLQRTLEEIKRKVADAAKDYEKCEAEQRKARVDAREQRMLDAVSKEIQAKLVSLKEEEERISQVVAPLTNGADLEVLDAPLSILKDGKEMAETLKEQLATARKSITSHELPKGVTAGAASSMRQVISKALQQVDGATKTVNGLIKAVSASALKVAEAVQRKTQLALRQEVLKRESSLEALFSEVAQGKDSVSRKELARWLGSLEDLKLSSEQVALMLDRLAGSAEEGMVSRWTFLRKFQQFYECQKNIALTNDLVITNSKPIRMLQAEEVIEVLQGPESEKKSGIERIRGRAMRDNTVGWVSLSGNQGSVFLKERPKPFVSCLMDLPLEKSFQTTGEAPTRSLKTDEVLEILEGPRQDVRDAVSRARVKTLKDSLTGWVTLSSGGEVQAQAGQQRFWCCKTGVAITDGPNIKVCKVLRKLEVGEVVRLLEGPEIDKDSGVTRLKALCIKDNLEGWVTTLGNAGTVYAEEKTDIYSVVCEALPLQKAFIDLSTGTLRMLQKDEAFEVLEGPKEFQPEPAERMKGRAVADGQVGWVTVTNKRVKRWYPSYICKQSCVMQDTLNTVSAGPSNTVRRVEEGELLEVLDGPQEDKEAKVLRIKAKARKDQAVGWITLKGNQGTVFLTQWSRKDEEQLKQKQRSLQEGLGKDA
eukprot:s2840_g12.t2